MATTGNVSNSKDIDRDFNPDGTETLDQFRERVLRDLQQPGFGNAGQPAAKAADAE